jgi:large subunit ribosomal protein L14
VIQKLTNIRIIDNSGARKAICISTPPGFKATIGDVILLSLRNVLPTSKFKKGQVVKAVIVSVKKSTPQADGSSFSFNSNSAILLNAQGLPVAKRINGPISSKLRQHKFLKLLFVSSVIL